MHHSTWYLVHLSCWRHLSVESWRVDVEPPNFFNIKQSAVRRFPCQIRWFVPYIMVGGDAARNGILVILAKARSIHLIPIHSFSAQALRLSCLSMDWKIFWNEVLVVGETGYTDLFPSIFINRDGMIDYSDWSITKIWSIICDIERTGNHENYFNTNVTVRYFCIPSLLRSIAMADTIGRSLLDLRISQYTQREWNTSISLVKPLRFIRPLTVSSVCIVIFDHCKSVFSN